MKRLPKLDRVKSLAWTGAVVARERRCQSAGEAPIETLYEATTALTVLHRPNAE